MKIATTATVAALVLLLAPEAFAQTMYKLVDKDGKVTYSNEPPKNFQGTVTKIEVDPKANRMVAPKGRDGQTIGEELQEKRESARASEQSKVAAARAKLESARKAYEQARDNPGEADVRRVGTVSGGSRPVFSDEYQAKLDQLEAAVRQAEEELRRAERG